MCGCRVCCDFRARGTSSSKIQVLDNITDVSQKAIPTASSPDFNQWPDVNQGYAVVQVSIYTDRLPPWILPRKRETDAILLMAACFPYSDSISYSYKTVTLSCWNIAHFSYHKCEIANKMYGITSARSDVFTAFVQHEMMNKFDEDTKPIRRNPDFFFSRSRTLGSLVFNVISNTIKDSITLPENPSSE